MAGVTTVGATGNKDIDGLLSGYKWTGVVTYSFPDSPTDYGSGSYGVGEPTASGFGQLSAAEQTLMNRALSMVSGYTNLVVQYAGTNSADIRIAHSSKVNPTAYAYYPWSNEGGDVWFGTSYNYTNPKIGDYSYVTHLHELGHALGLKHSQEAGGPGNTSVPTAHDSLEYTIMSYRSYTGGPTTGYTNETYGYPTTYMMNDIRALQQMYGANFNTNSGDTVYTWSQTTGESFINGVGQGQPGANKIFMTVWDGGGNDTYDFSNYTTGVTVNLNPGSYSVASSNQLASLGGGQYAHGNVYNALLYNNDSRSYIENVIGGSGNDTLIGNAINNRIDGGAGNDTLTGGAGSDTFVFHSGYGADIITDFSVGFDKVDISELSGFYALGDVLAIAAQTGANTILNFGFSLSLTLQNVALSALSAIDFIFDPNAPSVPNAAPTAIALNNLAVDEHTAGAVIGQISVVDPDNTAFTFSVSDSRFQVVGTPGAYLLKLVTGASLDYDTQHALDLAVTAKDPAGNAITGNFHVVINDIAGPTILGTEGRDLIDGLHTVAGQARATIDDDTIYGYGGNDVIYGLAGNDRIDGGDGNDIIFGDAGNDRIIGGAGDDRLYGGTGDDVFVISGNDAQLDTIVGGDGTDSIEVVGHGRCNPLPLLGQGVVNRGLDRQWRSGAWHSRRRQSRLQRPAILHRDCLYRRRCRQ